MNIQASRMAASMAAPGFVPVRLEASAVGPRTAAASKVLAGGDTVTISQAARDLAERDAPIRPVLAVGLAPVASERSTADGPVNAISSSSQDYKAAIGHAMDSLEFQRNSKLITEAQFRHDMAFYTRVANAVA